MDLQRQLVGSCLAVRVLNSGRAAGKAVTKIPGVGDTTGDIGTIASGHLRAVQQDDTRGYAAIYVLPW